MLSFETLVDLYAQGRHIQLASLAGECLIGEKLAAPDRSVAIIAIGCAVAGRHDDAERLLQALIAADPLNREHRMNLAVLWLQIGRAADARQLLEVLHAGAPDAQDVMFNLGVASFAVADYSAASRLLEQVLRTDPNHFIARLYLARSLVETGDVQDAQVLAGDLQPSSEPLPVREQEELARLYAALDQPERAERMLRDLLAASPAEDSAKISLAALLERANQVEEAQAWLDRVADGQRATAVFIAVQGKLHAARKDWSQALQCFDEGLSTARATTTGATALSLCSDLEFGRGHALDKLGRHGEAHAALVRANELIRDHHRLFHPPSADEGLAVRGLRDRPDLDAPVLAAVDEVTLSDEDTPIFLVGFPRSGTTLLDQILDAHPGLQVLEEKPALDTVAAAFQAHSAGYPDGIASLTLADAAALRRVYWTKVARYLERKPGTRMVDKYPLNLARLHLAMRLFPKAQWIFAIRHPCDVVLSCFMQNFRFTETTHGFWSIVQTASIYDQVMNLWLEQRERLRPDCLDLRYEDLVADFEPNARRLIGFLGLPWDDAVLRFNEHAKTRRISTPSYNQVVQPIYRSATGRWQHYAQFFDEALPLLQPFFARLGYDG